MVRLLFFALLLLSLVGCEKIEVYKSGNKSGEPLDFKPREVQCVKCTMELEGKVHSAQAVLPDGKTFFFDDPGCLALWLKGKEREKIRLWVYTNDTKHYIDAEKAWYRLGEKTPMNYGFGAYEKRVRGSVNFDTFLTMMYRGENMTNPAIRRRILEERGSGGRD
ncbi:MAG: hypothetical protein GXO19_04230 [Epsilonproteobacteria bacterium]|nr:hypothetical protein [Campylobacterota bacterium]NPA56930.1 hypothetical protein [Campylobacterota bacterium]